LRQVTFRGGMLSSRTGRRHGMAFDSTGRLYIADTFQGTVTVYDTATGETLGAVGSFGMRAGQLSLPAAVAIDPCNRLYVTSAGNGRVELYGLDTYLHLTAEPPTPAVAAGTGFVLRAIAGGPGPFFLQWQKDSEDLVDGGRINGATNSTLTISDARAADGGGYSVMVTGPAGAFASSLAQVTVQAPPVILSGPGDATVLRGSPVEFSVSATGTDLNYQWQYEGLDIEGATNSTLVVADAQAHNAGRYVAIIKNAVGSLSSTPALLTVLVPPRIMEFLGLSAPAGLPLILTVNSDPGVGYVLDVSANLSDWAPLTTFTNDAGIMELIDADVTNVLPRFYRFRWLPPPLSP
jgi:hypothetical protein